jgi:hypothetical protein
VQNAPAAEILITAFHNKQWQVRYDLPRPTREMVFAHSPDDSRKWTWLADELFEILETDHGEVVRRKDGAEFTTLRIRMSAEYRVLPNDYAPFSPFGDGGMLFHTARFFACADVCPKDANWSMSLWADPKDSVLLNGNRESYYARWSDSGDGRMVYIGKNFGIKTNEFTAIIDSAMPDVVRAPMLAELPRVVENFAAKLGRLPTKPMVFASYDAAYHPGWGRQGGVLGNQILTHFYGEQWTEELRKPNFGLDLTWYFAHETAHLYQRQIYPNGPGDAWIHEGSAEAFAAIAMRERGSAEKVYVDARVALAKEKCTTALGDHSLDEVLSQTNDLSAAYSCGLMLNLAIDERIRNDNKDGLYAVWRDYLKTAARGPHTRAAYLEAVEHVGGEALKRDVQESTVSVHHLLLVK